MYVAIPDTARPGLNIVHTAHDRYILRSVAALIRESRVLHMQTVPSLIIRNSKRRH